MNCSKCGKKIIHVYTFENNDYGIECWKQYCLPQILALKEAKFKEIKHDEWLRNYSFIESLKSKDMSKITSTFKRAFIPSIIEQFETKGFISKKQEQILSSMLNGKDYKNITLKQIEMGIASVGWEIMQGSLSLDDFPLEQHEELKLKVARAEQGYID